MNNNKKQTLEELNCLVINHPKGNILFYVNFQKDKEIIKKIKEEITKYHKLETDDIILKMNDEILNEKTFLQKIKLINNPIIQAEKKKNNETTVILILLNDINFFFKNYSKFYKYLLIIKIFFFFNKMKVI